MTRILKRGQKTYFKEDVVACLADETMQKTFTQSEYGNRIVFMEELQEEAKERFDMDFTDEDYKSFKTLIAKDEYLLSLDDNAGILGSKALDIVVGYGRVKGGVSGLWEKEQAEYDQKEQLYADLLKKHPMKYDAKAECLWLPDGTRGVVEKVDDAGLVHVKWENGSGLNLDPLVDDFEVIEDELDLGENQQEDEMEL